MKFSENWLREWVDPDVDGDELCRQLTMAGLEVDEVTPAGPGLSAILIGAIEAIGPHPEADKLAVCKVDCGEGQSRQIVCGAPNARTGLRVPVALPGTRLPDGRVIESAELRGVRSDGMLCASNELGLSDDGAGLLELDPDAQPGRSLAGHLALDDRIIDIDLTPNRGDCLCLRGIAREVAVWNRVPVTPPPTGTVESRRESLIDVAIEDHAACSTYTGRSLFGVDADARTPDWMCERLRRSGIRPIFPVVDVTNYVMLELGQPMHAFDQNSLTGGITVRRAGAGEGLTLLDGQEVALDASTLVIADQSGPVAMAGVMGGARTGVAAHTRDVFLESACFNPLAVAGQGRRYKIHTDSLHRFERGVDPELQTLALERATQLILQIAGGEAGAIVRVGKKGPDARPVPLRSARIQRLLGTVVPDTEVIDILQRLEMSVQGTEDGWAVTPPSHRHDIQVEADLIEEVARIHGYDQLPSRPNPVFTAPAVDHEKTRPIATIRETLRQRGYAEAVTYSFVDPTLQAQLNPEFAGVDLDNPIADNLSQMRTTLWASLIPCWLHNARRQQKRVRLFETGLRFWRDSNVPSGVVQRETLAGLADGAAQPEHWNVPSRPLDFFDAKGDVEALLPGVSAGIEFRASEHRALHPGRCARVEVDGRPVGWLGQLHPRFIKVLDINQMPYLFELDYAAVAGAQVPRVQPISEFPEVRRDLAFSVPERVEAGELTAILRQSGESLLAQVQVFDVFTGGDLETGFKSIALSLIFQDKTSTLTSDAVDASVARLVEQAHTRCGATIRGQ